MIRRCALLLALSCAPLPQSGGASDAPAIARAIEARYHAAQTLRAVFLERYSESRGSIRVESGTVYFRRGGGMRWEYEAPEEKLFVSDGKTVWFYVPADRTVTRSRVRDSDDWRTPLGLLIGKLKLSRVCKRLELADVHVSAAGNSALRCLPHPGKSPFHEAILEADPGGRLVRVQITEAGGVETEFRFGRWEQDIPLADGLFRFTPPAGVAVVDDPGIARSTP